MNTLIAKSQKFLNILKNEGLRGGLHSAGQNKSVRQVKNKLASFWMKWKSEGGLVAAEVQGSKMWLNANDPGISRELYMTGVHESRTTALIRQELQKGMHTLDVGANIGYYALLQAQLVGSEGHVYTVEPVPQNFELLKKNIQSNGLSNVTAEQLAFSDENGSAEFITTSASNWGTMFSAESDGASEFVREKMKKISLGTIKVPTIKGDDFLAQRGIKQVNLIRMDVEGFEIQVLKGLDQTLRNASSPLKLLIEVHNKHFTDPAASLGPTFQRLLDYGFRPKVLIAKKDYYSNIDPSTFVQKLTSYKDICCHVLMEK